MFISLSRASSICHLVWLLASLWASSGYGAAIQTPASTLEDPGDNNYTDLRLLKRGKDSSKLHQILEASYEEETMLDPEGAIKQKDEHGNDQLLSQENDLPSNVEKYFGDVPWTITYYNGPRNYVFPIITAKGATIVKVPFYRVKEVSTGAGGLEVANDEGQYDKVIKNPVVGAGGILGQMVRDWMRFGQTDPKNWWFPDAIRIVAAGPFVKDMQRFRYEGTFFRLQSDILDLWCKGPNGRSFETIVDDPEQPRYHVIDFPGALNDRKGIKAWKARSYAIQGFAISWTPSADGSEGEYEIWNGEEDLENPWKKETLKRLRWSDAEGSFNWGYYPEGVVPTGWPYPVAGPGAGCHYEDPCAI